MGALAPIQDNLLLLSKLELVLSSPMVSGDWNDPIDCFSFAPRLRHVMLRAPAPALNLPWAQLETFRDHTGDHYKKLVDSQARELRVIVCFLIDTDQFPSHILSATNIHTLRFGFSIAGLLIQQHLDQLTLPMLRDLDIRWGHRDFPAVYGTVIQLIRRSGCSLDRLILDRAGDEDMDDFRTMLSLCPDLTELAIQVMAKENLLELVPCANRPDSFVLPKLKFLTLFLIESVAGREDNGIPEALKHLMQERMEDLTSHGQGRRLEELRLILQLPPIIEDSLVLPNLQRWLANPDEPIAPPEGFHFMMNLFTRWSRTLERDPVWIRNEERQSKRIAPLLSLHRTLNALERQDLSKLGLQALISSGIPYLLREIANPQEPIPMEFIFRFRKRAKFLLDNWKAPLIASVRACSTCSSWQFYWDTVAVVRYPRIQESDEDIWKSIVQTHRLAPASLWVY
ncbi:hypothetical protein EST38_g5441 [Candolleomyces aberdarensis]|uniref:Uncharacterized protein n=1 Tax=Candolleomyces aberdarensis TaxID=2316362 RepID=A0A4Q2DNN5_9AGAR|nr:hypothetical protein EST38_g5441 [Candolleomyces aberdarensis]